MRVAAICLVLVAFAAACSDDADVTVAADAPPAGVTTTTADGGPSETLTRRDTPVGELVVTRGPATQPWRFDPNGPTDRWREPSRCYLPRLTVRVGDRTATIGDSDVDGSVVVPITLREESDDPEAAVAAVILGATDGHHYRLAAAEGVDDTTADGGLAVLVRHAEVVPSADNGSSWMQFTVHEVDAAGGEVELPVDLAQAENAFYAGDTNDCPNNTGVTPRPTVATPPDAADAAAVAARAFDPATPTVEAQALFGDDPDLAAELDAFHRRLAELAPDFKVTVFMIVPDGARQPVFHSEDDGWVPLSLASDTGFGGMSSWAKVERDGSTWRVDPRSVCAAFDQMIFSSPPDACGD